MAENYYAEARELIGVLIEHKGRLRENEATAEKHYADPRQIQMF